MLTFHSFLQDAYRFIKSLIVRVTKRMYRSFAVLTTGLAVVTVVTLNTSGFAGGGKNALAAFKEPAAEDDMSGVNETEEIETFTEAKIQVGLTASKEQGQHLVGNLLEKRVQRDLAKTAVEIERVEKEVLMQARAAEEEAKEKERLAKEQERKDQAVIKYSDSDYQVLLKIVQAEAGVCDDKGKILVANVIINRVKSQRFPNSITDVVYERHQFSPVSNGTINTSKVTQNTINCVDRALAGEDYSQGALFFMNRGASRSGAVSWFDSHLTMVLQHDRHEFFK